MVISFRQVETLSTAAIALLRDQSCVTTISASLWSPRRVCPGVAESGRRESTEDHHGDTQSTEKHPTRASPATQAVRSQRSEVRNSTRSLLSDLFGHRSKTVASFSCCSWQRCRTKALPNELRVLSFSAVPICCQKHQMRRLPGKRQPRTPSLAVQYECQSERAFAKEPGREGKEAVSLFCTKKYSQRTLQSAMFAWRAPLHDATLSHADIGPSTTTAAFHRVQRRLHRSLVERTEAWWSAGWRFDDRRL
jgi:hypothetical protein